MIEIPRFASEDEERDFWAIHDSVDFLDGAEQVTLEYREGDSIITGSNCKSFLYSSESLIEEKE